MLFYSDCIDFYLQHTVASNNLKIAKYYNYYINVVIYAHKNEPYNRVK